ncbi:DUF3795 domain-containing protein [Candidatus Thorarchaeota archaeon]|nr:MAG: DUF3795 domain-containing protein [Candidatus Thorarchaeota archaeon]
MIINMQAYCGLDCSECPAHIAYINDDDSMRSETVEKWNSPQFPVTVDMLDCAGCKSEGPHFAFWSKCNIQLCASKRNVETCAHCGDYGCDTLEEWLTHAGENSRKKLESIHDSL